MAMFFKHPSTNGLSLNFCKYFYCPGSWKTAGFSSWFALNPLQYHKSCSLYTFSLHTYKRMNFEKANDVSCLSIFMEVVWPCRSLKSPQGSFIDGCLILGTVHGELKNIKERYQKSQKQWKKIAMGFHFFSMLYDKKFQTERLTGFYHEHPCST